jgi:hypothetical protein
MSNANNCAKILGAVKLKYFKDIYHEIPERVGPRKFHKVRHLRGYICLHLNRNDVT